MRFVSCRSVLLSALVAACGGASASDTESAMKVEWAERTCDAPYEEGPYAEADVFFEAGRANVPLPAVFDASSDSLETKGVGRIDLPLDGTPIGVGARIVACGTELETVSRVLSTSPLVVERRLTWQGTRATPCEVTPLPPPTACRVVQKITYPVDAPR